MQRKCGCFGNSAGRYAVKSMHEIPQPASDSLAGRAEGEVAQRTFEGRNATLKRGLPFCGYRNERTYGRVFEKNETVWILRCIFQWPQKAKPRSNPGPHVEGFSC